MGLFDILSSVVPGVGRTVRDVENVTDAASSTSSAGSAVGSAAAGIVGSAVSMGVGMFMSKKMMDKQSKMIAEQQQQAMQQQAMQMQQMQQMYNPGMQQQTVPSMYYAVVDGQQMGPLDITALQQMICNQQVKADTMMWKPTMQAWAQAATLPELAAFFAAPPSL